MHDKNGNTLQVGDPVILTGRIKAFTSEQPTYCNITVLCDETMAPDAAEGYGLALSARMVIKGKLFNVPVDEVQSALRAAACEIRGLKEQLRDTHRNASARENALADVLCRIAGGNNRYPDGFAVGLKGEYGGLETHLEGLAGRLEAMKLPEGPAGLDGTPGAGSMDGIDGEQK